VVLPTEPTVSDANAHRPSAVATKAVGCPATAVVTGFCAASTLPAGATAVEQPTVSGTGAAAARCDPLEEHPARMTTALADTTVTSRWQQNRAPRG
jgi:hypothetical protein